MLETHNFTETFTKKLDIEKVVKSLSEIDFLLEQETNDSAQLNPVERMNSIKNVWDACRSKLGSPKTAIDAGSGFGYGTVFLESQGIQVVGVENVQKKIDQGQALFGGVGVNLNRVESLDFNKSPALYNADFNQLSEDQPVDLITLFYLSGAMIQDPALLGKCQRLLSDTGNVLAATEAPKEQVKAVLDALKISGYEIIDIPHNFEKTAIIIKKQAAQLS